MKATVQLIIIAFLTISFSGCSKNTSSDVSNSLSETKGAHQTPSLSDDGAVLEQLRQAGSDLSKPHEIDFYFYFADESVAQRAATKIRGSGLKVEVRPGATGKDWLCLAKKTMVPKLSDIENITREFERLAIEFGGEFDGWETAVMR